MKFDGNKQILSVLGKKILLSCFGLRNDKKVVRVTVDGTEIPFEQKDDKLFFAPTNITSTLELEIEK